MKTLLPLGLLLLVSAPAFAQEPSAFLPDEGTDLYTYCLENASAGVAKGRLSPDAAKALCQEISDIHPDDL